MVLFLAFVTESVNSRNVEIFEGKHLAPHLKKSPRGGTSSSEPAINDMLSLASQKLDCGPVAPWTE